MHPYRRKKVYWISLLLLGLGLALSLVLYALRQNIDLYYTPSQLLAASAPKAQEYRLGGVVQAKSINREPGTLTIHFNVTDFHQTVPVQYTGILPDLFREGQGVVVSGRLSQAGLFIAEQVLAKHDENYHPPGIH